jgi:hypothetical protein
MARGIQLAFHQGLVPVEDSGLGLAKVDYKTRTTCVLDED